MQLTARVDAAEALRYLGHRGQALDDAMKDQLEGAILLCESVPAAGLWCIFDVCGPEGAQDVKAPEGVTGQPAPGVRLKGPLAEIVLPGQSITDHLRGAKKVALMAVTLGLRNEQLAKREFARGSVPGLLFDACGSAMVESAADALCEALAAEAAQDGLVCGARFSPGYGDLPLDVQPAFLRATGAGKALGITLTPGNLMVPAKSVTAAVGLFEAGKAVQTDGARAAGGNDALAHSTPNFSAKGRTCETCAAAQGCLLRAQGRTCYGG
jgi:hypothetical protein